MNGIWIRSQDRKSIRTVTFASIYEVGTSEELKVAYKKANDSGSEEAVEALNHCMQDQDHLTLGRYATKARALEVLDEIQHAIIKGAVAIQLLSGLGLERDKSITDVMMDEIASYTVFEMPLK